MKSLSGLLIMARSRAGLLSLFLVWSVSAAYVWQRLDRGWVPHDEGAIAQSAERVLLGEYPHRDYDEIYTGGLSYLNAGGFAVLGTTLATPRRLLFLLFLATVPAIHYIASRFVGAASATLVTALCVAWSLPLYPAAIPSWYNLFLLILGVAALLRYWEEPRKRWLYAAGVLTGLSLLAKVVGLYFVAAVLLTFLYWEQTGPQADEIARGRYQAAYSALLVALLTLLAGAVLLLIWTRARPSELFHFFIPTLAVVAFLVWTEAHVRRGAILDRVAAHARLAGPFLVGVAIPCAVFAGLYATLNALPGMLQNVFADSVRRLQFAAVEPPALSSAAAVLPFVAALSLKARSPRSARPRMMLITAVCLTLLLGLSHVTAVYRLVWAAVRVAAPVTVLMGVAALASGSVDRKRAMPLVLLIATTALWGLVQFPFAAPIYFCYVAPVVILCITALISSLNRRPSAVPAALAMFLLLFALLRLHPGFIYGMGIQYSPVVLDVPLPGRGGNVMVSRSDQAEYLTLLSTLRRHADGEYVYVTPDAPEVYFLSHLKNPTPTLFDFFDDQNERTKHILGVLDARAVRVVVLNSRPWFSGEVPTDLRAALTSRFPYHERVGRFTVRWRR